MKKTLLKYAGNKQGIMCQITQHFQWKGIKNYIEPFAGALGAALNADIPAEVSIKLNDANKELIEFYKAVKENPDEVEKIANEFPNGKEGYLFVREKDRDFNWILNSTKFEKAARTIYLNKRCFNGLYRVNKAGHFNVPWNKNLKPAPISIVENKEFIDFLNRSQFSSRDWSFLVAEAGAGDLIYCDPPYVDLNDSDSTFHGYIGGFSLSDQINLRDMLVEANRRGAQVVVSNSYCEKTLEIFKDWEIHEIVARRRISRNSSGRILQGEILAILR